MKSLSLAVILPLSLIALSVNQAVAQSSEDIENTKNKVADETIVITATRYQQDVDKIPGAITVITKGGANLSLNSGGTYDVVR